MQGEYGIVLFGLLRELIFFCNNVSQRTRSDDERLKLEKALKRESRAIRELQDVQKSHKKEIKSLIERAKAAESKTKSFSEVC